MATTDPYLGYLTLPSEYALFMGGVHWSAAGDSLIRPDGTTFALTPQIATFLEGFASQKRVIPFGQIMHMLAWLGVGTVPETERGPYSSATGTAPFMAESFRQTGSPLRNMGALCGHLAKGLPPAHRVPDVGGRGLARWLLNAPSLAGLANPESGITAEVPRMKPFEFFVHINAAWTQMPPAEMLHWLKHGRGPIAEVGDGLAENLLDLRTPASAKIDALLSDRDRLLRVKSLIPTLISALTLPPRPMDPSPLPLGGYSDVTNRGKPEALLPSQFAVEGDEFIRRFASNELLYFRREEPPQHRKDVLVLALDQGVRTWGNVRLGLTAAVPVLIRLAERRGLPVQLTVSSEPDQVHDLATIESAKLGDMLEMSDLSADVTNFLDGVISSPTLGSADIVVMTHPRNLQSPELLRIATDLPPEVRLFALGIDGAGNVAMGPMRDGRFMPQSRCKISFEPERIEPDPTTAQETLPLIEKTEPGWTGVVKPWISPFRIGVIGPIQAMRFTADGQGLILVTERHELLHMRLPLWTPVTEREPINLSSIYKSMPSIENQSRCMLLPMIHPQADNGASGFDFVEGMENGVVFGYHQPDPIEMAQRVRAVAAYLDLMNQHAIMHSWGTMPGTWHLDEDGAILHVNEFLSMRWQILADILSNDVDNSKARVMRKTLRRDEWFNPDQHDQNDSQQLSIFGDQVGRLSRLKRSGQLRLVSMSDILLLRAERDGVSTLHDASFAPAMVAKTRIVIPIRRPTGTEFTISLLVCSVSSGTLGVGTTREFPCEAALANVAPLFALSADGDRLAWMPKPGMIEVVSLTDDVCLTRVPIEEPIRVTEVGVRKGSFAIRCGDVLHTLTWDEGPLKITSQPGIRAGIAGKYRLFGIGKLTGCEHWKCRDPDSGNWAIRGDSLGNVYVNHPRDGSIVMTMLLTRNALAIMLPDGTRWGLDSLTGGLATPDALDKIARVLRAGPK